MRSVDVNVLRHVDRAAKLSECVAVSMENGRHFGFLSGCAAQDVRATLGQDPPLEAILVFFGQRV